MERTETGTMKALYTPPLIVRNIFNDFFWTSSQAKVLLTFDDGPIPETTETILKELDRIGAKGIFFCVGNNVSKNPSLAKEIASAGHIIANHTFNHQKIAFKSLSFQTDEINKCTKTIEDITGNKVQYFRPPHGRIDFRTAAMLQKTGLRGVLWSLLTLDYKNNLNIVKFAVKKYLKNDSIIVLHDSLKSKDIIVDAIGYIAEETSKNGFTFGDPKECLK
jgi:peptidoglycan/xylan/chitin deacetylase (PgdA/CDA1 family)